jgi:hypothetical protein
MPRYAIERQYLLPVYHHLIVEADSLEAACFQAVEIDDWPEADTKQDFDNARPTTIAAAVVVDEQHRDEDPTWLLYEAGLPPCEIPAEYIAPALHILTIQWRSWDRTIEAFATDQDARDRMTAISLEHHPEDEGDLDAFSEHGHSWWIDEVSISEGATK